MSKSLSGWLSERSMSQRAFAEKIGVRQASVARIAAGLQFPRRALRHRILQETDGEVDVYHETHTSMLGRGAPKAPPQPVDGPSAEELAAD